ncbi:MAG TPA: Na+/H+ antiporter [Streptosporangiaceae bacterium]
MRSVETILFLVLLGTVVAVFAGRLRVPAPSLLVIAGIVAGYLPGIPQVQVPPHAVSLIVLPPLLYAATDELPLRDLRAVWRPVVVLAIGLVLASAAAVAAVASALAAIPVSLAFVLGAVLASTDPVAVSALGRRLSLPPKVQALVQGESLFNDATSLVLFQIAVAIAVGGAATAGSWPIVLLKAAGQFALLAGGGAVLGAVVATGIIVVRKRVTDPVLETVIALITPYAAYVLGAVAHVSPVMTVIVTGLVVGSRRFTITTPATRLQVHAFYQPVIFLLESVVFALIGLELPALIGALAGSAPWPAIALAVMGTLLAVRIAWVFPLSALSQRRRGPGRLSWPVPAIVTWSGTRGVVPLAAALSIPLTASDGSSLPHRDLILVVTAAVIVLSLVVQGLTLEPLVRFAGLATAQDTGAEEARARVRLAEVTLARLDELASDGAAAGDVIERARARAEVRLDRDMARLSEAAPPTPPGLTDRDVGRDLIAAESAELGRLFSTGQIGDGARRRLQHDLDLEATRLRGD